YSYIYELGRGLAARGHVVDVIASTRGADPSPPFDLEGMTIHTYSYRKINPVLSILQHLNKTVALYRGIAANQSVDVLSIHDSHLGLKLARSALGRSAVQIPTYHAPVFLEFRFNTQWSIQAERSLLRRLIMRATEPPLEDWQRRFEASVLRRAQGIVVLSKYSRGHIENNFPSIDLSRVKIIPGGVDVERFKPAESKSEVRRALGLDEDTVQLLTVRKLVPRMGLENLIRAIPTIVGSSAAEGVKVRLTICGRGHLRPMLEELSRELGVADAVNLTGNVSDEDLVRHYQAADLFVLPTTALEGFGISTVEALSTNLPVVGTPAGATPEILTAIDERLLTASASASSIAEAVVGWLSWRHEDTGSSRYRDEVLAKYSWDRVSDQVESYYSELLRDSKGVRGSRARGEAEEAPR
ncbi:glycosyltransferase family 4 protein, partial [bacterium]|nr:glycosyltransferase family 4 protein [bacterium]